MEHIGIDLGKTSSQICILAEDGELIERRIKTTRAEFGEWRARARVLIEASTESEWVARCLEEMGHEVVVADPNFASMYATRSRRVKTDKRDCAHPLQSAPTGHLPPRASHLRNAASDQEAAQHQRDFGPDTRQIYYDD